MILRFIPFLILFGFHTISYSQHQELSVSGISPELTAGANAVIRNEEIKVVIDAVDKMTIYTTRTVTILNEYGDRHTAAGQYYDNNLKIKNQKVSVYDAEGKEIKQFKQKDFRDVSGVGSNDLFTDNRIEYLEFTPQKYPYTMVYESEVQNRSTVFINPWEPIPGFHVSVESASYEFQNPSSFPVRIEEKNFGENKFFKTTTVDGLKYTVTNLPAFKREVLSPDLEDFNPVVKIALNEFSLVGVKGSASNWKELGKWQYDHLLSGKASLPIATVNKITGLTSAAKTDIEKAEIIYQYVQDNTRYISVQLGIGGWEPMPAEAVDRLGYGDCKALTNYTKALLDSQGITSHYAVVFAGEEIKDISSGFASMQGNHVILNIPQEGEDIWLECTSQTTPFNYIGDFTDNRNVLLVKPEGGEVVKTKQYTFSENLQETFTKIELDETGAFTARVKRTSKGIPYGNIYHLTRKTKEEQELFYKDKWGHLQALEIKEISFDNNRKHREFSEEVILNGKRYTTSAGKSLLLPTNFFSVETFNVPRTNERKMDLEIQRGHTYRDTFEFTLPAGYEAESIPQEEKIENQFGNYKIAVQYNEDARLIKVVREYIVCDGSWPAESYNGFRDFMNKINSLNNQKAVLVAIN